MNIKQSALKSPHLDYEKVSRYIQVFGEPVMTFYAFDSVF